MRIVLHDGSEYRTYPNSNIVVRNEQIAFITKKSDYTDEPEAQMIPLRAVKQIEPDR